jgi:hypothetical protein
VLLTTGIGEEICILLDAELEFLLLRGVLSSDELLLELSFLVALVPYLPDVLPGTSLFRPPSMVFFAVPVVPVFLAVLGESVVLTEGDAMYFKFVLELVFAILDNG